MLLMLLNPVPLSSCNPWGSSTLWSWKNGSLNRDYGEGPSELIFGDLLTLLLSTKAEQNALAVCAFHYSLSFPGHPHAMLPLVLDLQDFSVAS